MASKRFLIVDDDERFASLVSSKLKKHAHCTISLSGKDAVLQFEHNLRKNEPFDAVFMDIVMPKMNGHEAVAKMRKSEKLNQVSPVKEFKLIMLTAHKDIQNVSKSFFKDGADAFISKESLSKVLVEELKKIELI